MILVLLLGLILIFMIPTISVNKRFSTEGRAGLCTRGPVFTRKEVEERPQKVDKIPSQTTSDILMIASLLSFITSFIVLIIASRSDAEHRILQIIGVIILIVGIIAMIRSVNIISLIHSKGRSHCCGENYPKPDDYEPSAILKCLEGLGECSGGSGGCGFGFLIFFFDLIYLLIRRKK